MALPLGFRLRAGFIEVKSGMEDLALFRPPFAEMVDTLLTRETKIPAFSLVVFV
jgi:hypothetical protein